jgi:hypothetical protein
VATKEVEYQEVLGELASVARTRGRSQDVTILAHEAVTLRRLDDLRGLVMKAGFSTPRVFYFRSDKRLMVEITYGVAQPYSE